MKRLLILGLILFSGCLYNVKESNTNNDFDCIGNIEVLYNNELIYHDSISRKFRSLMFSKHFRWEVTAYKILENQGINIIRNPKLKESILSNYNMRYPEVKDFLENFSNNLKD